MKFSTPTPEQRLREIEMLLAGARQAQRDAATVDQHEAAGPRVAELEEEHAALWDQVHGDGVIRGAADTCADCGSVLVDGFNTGRDDTCPKATCTGRSAPEIMREIHADVAEMRRSIGTDMLELARSLCLGTPVHVLPTPTEAAERRHAYRVPSRDEIAARAELRGDTLYHREEEAERRSSTDRRRRNDEVIV